jgi:hypothetical protein
LAAFVLSLFLKEIPLRGTARAAATDMGDGFAMPEPPDADQGLERALANLLRKERGQWRTAVLAASPLDEAEAWCVVKVAFGERRHGAGSVAEIAEQVHVPAKVLQPAFDHAVDAGFLRSTPDGLHLTELGEDEFGTLAGAWQNWVTERLADWNPEATVDLPVAMARLARRLFDEQSTEPQPVRAG